MNVKQAKRLVPKMVRMEALVTCAKTPEVVTGAIESCALKDINWRAKSKLFVNYIGNSVRFLEIVTKNSFSLAILICMDQHILLRDFRFAVLRKVVQYHGLIMTK